MAHPAIETLYDQLAQFPLRIGHEKRAQADLEQHLVSGGIPFAREVVLSQQDIPDFVIDTDAGAVVVELKIRAQRKRIYKQLERYAQHKAVVALILVTATPMGLPEVINEKPAFVLSIGQGWL